MSDLAPDQLRSIVERIERLNEELKGINDDKAEVFAEAKANGFDVPVLKKLITDRAKDPAKREEFEAVYELYEGALRGAR
jgi:uncharacterized protein (UPF0335 family)